MWRFLSGRFGYGSLPGAYIDRQCDAGTGGFETRPYNLGRTVCRDRARAGLKPRPYNLGRTVCRDRARAGLKPVPYNPGRTVCRDRARAGLETRPYNRPLLASWISDQRYWGVSGSRRMAMPRGLRASSTALASTAGGPTVPVSPAPLNPPGR